MFVGNKVEEFKYAALGYMGAYMLMYTCAYEPV